MPHLSLSAFGVTYPSIRKAAAAFGIPESTLRHRLENDWDIEVALIVSTGRVTLGFMGLDGKAYYRVSWLDKNSAEYGSGNIQTSREIVEHYRPDLLDAYDKSNPTGEYHPYKKG